MAMKVLNVCIKTINGSTIVQNYFNFPNGMEDECSIIIPFKEGISNQQQLQMQRTICNLIKQQIKKRMMTVGFHHSKLIPSPSSWKYLEMNMIQLINLHLLGSTEECVTALQT